MTTLTNVFFFVLKFKVDEHFFAWLSSCGPNSLL